MISLFYSIAQQTKVDAGWDPTVLRKLDGRYVFMIGGKRYTTTKELATYRTDLMFGSATRVYKAEDEQGHEVAIKDLWRDTERDHEGLIMEKILQDIETKLGQEMLTEAKKYLVAIRAYEDVHISGKLDKTLHPGKDGRWIEINDNPQLSEKLHVPSTGHIPDSSYLPSISLQRTSMPFQQGENKEKILCRAHARIVFDDVGTPLTNVSILRDSLACVRDALKGKQFLSHPLCA